MPSRDTVRPADLVSAGEFSHTLRINASTLHRWVESGRVVPVLIAGTRFYYRADMERIAAERATA
jgi:DNA-binding transcriptional MerR regulator